MIYTIPPSKHDAPNLLNILTEHPQIRFASFVAADIFGRDTDEKIPVSELLENDCELLRRGVQTDGSSVLLPLIADISDAKVTLMADFEANWYVDYNFDNIDEATNLPVGTLRIPAYLVHNDKTEVGSRTILKGSIETFKAGLAELLAKYPYIFDYLPFDSADQIQDISITAATELEFYVKTPQEATDKDRLHTSQELKEQYWKRTVGPVRTAMEQAIVLLDKYGFDVEMGHKEVGGVSAELIAGGDFDHIMEQLEIDWKYSDPMQAADSDALVRYIVRDIFRRNGLAVTYMAKPVEGVAGSGKHTHVGVIAKLKDGRKVNLFSPLNFDEDYMNPIGFGAIMGLLKNYEVIGAIANCTTDALNRLKPGYEAPVCVATSLGKSVSSAGRNRTVLVGLIRDVNSPMATHFELRSPNPKSNTFLVVGACLMAMLDGIRAVLEAGKTSPELEKSLSKEYGTEDFYLEKDRMYRAECNIFEAYTQEDREKLFGKAIYTAWEAIAALDENPEKAAVLCQGDSFSPLDLASFKAAALDQWQMELRDRLVPEMRSAAKRCKRLHGLDSTDLDEARWQTIEQMVKDLVQDSSHKISLLTLLTESIERGDYATASVLQLKAAAASAALEKLYSEYKKNLL